MLHRQDYVRIAKVLCDTRPFDDPLDIDSVPFDAIEQWNKDRSAICDVLGEDNPKFDAERFDKACLAPKDE